MISVPRAAVSILALAACAAGFVACGSDGSEPGGASADDTRAMLGRLADDVFVPAVADFQTDAEALAQAVQAHADAPEDEQARDAAREAWRAAMARWQVLEPLQIGPALPPAQGGEDLRSRIYSWPATGPCLIDQALVSQAYAEDGFAEDQLVNGLGLDALEYLLFNEGDESACAPTVDIIDSGDWDAAVASGLASRRADYAAVVAADVGQAARQLAEAWETYREQWAQAGAGSDRYDMTQDALNELSNALFYLDTETKSMKLGEPSGRDAACGAEGGCPDEVEHPYAQFSKQAVAANLEGAALALRGACASDAEPPCGLFDLLRTLGAGDVASSMDQALDGAAAAVDAIEPSLQGAVAQGDAEPAQAYDALRELTVLLKTDFITTLDLSPPDSAAADND